MGSFKDNIMNSKCSKGGLEEYKKEELEQVTIGIFLHVTYNYKNIDLQWFSEIYCDSTLRYDSNNYECYTYHIGCGEALWYLGIENDLQKGNYPKSNTTYDYEFIRWLAAVYNKLELSKTEGINIAKEFPVNKLYEIYKREGLDG